MPPTCTPAARRLATLALAAALLALGAGGRWPARAAPAAHDEDCGVSGVVRLDGREDHAGVVVGVPDGPETTTEADGRFLLEEVAPGALAVRARFPGYLSAEAVAVPCPAGAVAAMAPLGLPGGDPDGNDRVDLFDLVRVAAGYRTCAADAGYEAGADLNASGCVDLFDLVLVTASYGWSGPQPWSAVEEPGPEPGAVSYAANVVPIFELHCPICHGTSGGLHLDTYERLMAGGDHGPVVVPGDPQASALYLRVSRQVLPAMPPGGLRLPDADVETIRRWIAAGAPNN